MAASNTSIYTVGVPAVPAAATCCSPACVGLECLDRTRWFAGQLITESDLNNEQSYLLAKNRLHNRFLHGWGVVCGMQVECGECVGWVTVKTGYAIDPCGNDIIVCTDQPFNVIKAIQACCTPSRQTVNCAPLRYTPPAECKDMQQKWCITIQYQEQQSRMVTPLRQIPAMSSSCGCQSSNPQSQAKGVSIPTGACEPTRIVEGFQLGVIPAQQTTEKPPPPATTQELPQSALVQCILAVTQLISQAPNFANQNVTDPNTAYQEACSFRALVQKYLAGSSPTHCQILDEFNAIQIPTLQPGQTAQDYINNLQSIVNSILIFVFVMALDCICVALLPPCSPDPCDNRLILACVTVQNGEIIDICHFGSRQQVITFPVLHYWLSLFGIDNLLVLLNSFLDQICCGNFTQRSDYLRSLMVQSERPSTTGIANSAAVIRTMSALLAQTLGATILNGGAPEPGTVDLRPLVGQRWETVNRTLSDSYKIANITQINVQADTAWTDDAVAASSRFAPAAFPITKPLTVFTKNELVVGFEATAPTDLLRKQVSDLQDTVTQLRHQVSALQRPGGGPSA